MAYIFLFSSFIKFSLVFSNTAIQSDEIKNSVGWFAGHERSPLRLQAISAPLTSDLCSAHKRSPLRLQAKSAPLGNNLGLTPKYVAYQVFNLKHVKWHFEGVENHD